MTGHRQSGDATSSTDKDGAALRCHCGSLLARLVPDGVEIKCRRCKRRVVLPLSTNTVTNRSGAAS